MKMETRRVRPFSGLGIENVTTTLEERGIESISLSPDAVIPTTLKIVAAEEGMDEPEEARG